MGFTEMPLTVIGVVKDFHFDSLLHAASRTGHPQSGQRFQHPGQASGECDPGDAMTRLGRVLKSLELNWPFTYVFLREIDRLYRTDQRLGQGVHLLHPPGLVRRRVGLFGLAAFTAERRTKEIGIRKVLGASILDIIGLLTREFVRFVLLANLIAWPVAYQGMEKLDRESALPGRIQSAPVRRRRRAALLLAVPPSA
ncbi:MAG: hypothetical protein MZV63_46810 [Marinilabiliales bacterium]|nr:hypothetical protein [Marinilabiliales bacterium]